MNYPYFSYTRVIAAVALFAGVFLLLPGKLFFLNDDFIHLNLTSQGKWLQQNSFRPVCDLSMWVDYKLWGLNATGFHLTNALLHFANAFLVYRFSSRFLERYHQAAIASANGMLIAAIFLVYAFHSETLYWVIGRSSSLGALFFLLSMIWYLERHVSRRHYLLSILFFIIALSTYESTWITPLAFAVISYMDIRQSTGARRLEVRYITASLAVMFIYFLVRYISIQQLVSSYEGERFRSFDIKGLSVNYAKLILRSFSKQTGDLYLIISSFFIGITAFASSVITKKRSAVTALCLLWLLSYLPYLSLGIDTFGSEGERYLYLPSIFFAMITGLGIVNAGGKYKYAISLLYFLVHIMLLYDARINYEVASAVTKATVTEMGNAGSGKHFYFIALPKENKGAVIFRDGIQAAAHLFADPSNTVRLHSQYDGNFESFTGVSEYDAMALKNRPGTVVTFDYSKNSLIVSYLPPGTISE